MLLSTVRRQLALLRQLVRQTRRRRRPASNAGFAESLEKRILLSASTEGQLGAWALTAYQLAPETQNEKVWKDRVARVLPSPGLSRNRMQLNTGFVPFSEVNDFAALLSSGETEPNNTPGTAPLLAGFGTGAGDDSEADISLNQDGVLTSSVDNSSTDVGDQISTAFDTSGLLTPGGNLVGLTGQTLGDGAFGATTGDFDFYRVSLLVGQQLYIEVDTDDGLGIGTSSTLDSVLGIYDSSGNVVTHNDDQFLTFFPGNGLDSGAILVAPTAGDYYLAIGGWSTGDALESLPTDPTVAGTGPGDSSTGVYDLLLGIDAGDHDFVSIELEAGDVLEAGVSGGFGILSIRNPDGSEAIGSSDNVNLYPVSSPLGSVSGSSTAAFVAPTTATYAVGVSLGEGALTLALRAFRPGLETQAIGAAQYLFLDFDGETIDASSTFGTGNTIAVLSPLASFLSDWGLTGADEDAVINSIIATVEENLVIDMAVSGNNGDYATSGVDGEFDLRILNSRDHVDLFNSAANLSRVIVGGTVTELNISTIGIAQSIDIGNFATSETAVVLLDSLSAAASDLNSLNGIVLDAASDIIDLIGVAVGNIISHEAGHYIGNYHTDQFFTAAGIMDQGGNPSNIIGLGADGIFGSADDIDVDFTTDTLVPNEGFTGRQDSLNTTAFGLATGTGSGANLDVLSGELLITGNDDSAFGDTIVLRLDSSSDIAVLMDDISVGTFDPALVSSVVINSRGGSDQITVSPLVGIPITIDGSSPAFPNGGSGDTLLIEAAGFLFGSFTDNGDGSGSLTDSEFGTISWSDIENVTPPVFIRLVLSTHLNGPDNSNRSGIRDLTLNFSDQVAVNSSASLKLFNHTTGQHIDLSAAVLAGNDTSSVTWDLSDIVLPDGLYSAELAVGAVTPNLLVTHTFAFHKLKGDVNGNGVVSFSDYTAVNSNFGAVVEHFDPGDSNGDGAVSFGDYTVVNSVFGSSIGSLEFDFGDAPDSVSFPTMLANDGARHAITGNNLLLGVLRDSESDGQSSASATGDDTDEDGVVFGSFEPGLASSITVTANVPGSAVLNGWIDFNRDGDWDDAGEQVFVDEPIVDGANNLSVNVPLGISAGSAFARFRLTETGGYSWFGFAPNGEIEDYKLPFTVPSSPQIVLGPSDNIALDQPRATVLLTQDLDGDQQVGPFFFNEFLLDTGANSILVMSSAVTEMKGGSYVYQTEGEFAEQGVAGLSIYDIGAPYYFYFAANGNGYVPESPLPNTRVLSNSYVDFSPFGPWGIAGMPLMDGRVTTIDMSGWSGGLDDDLGNLNLVSTFLDTLPDPDVPGHRFTVQVDNRVAFDAEHGILEGEHPPIWSDIPFMTGTIKANGIDITGNVLLDTGAQLGILSSDVGFALNLDSNGDGVLDRNDHNYVETFAVGGVGGTIEAHMFFIEEFRLPTVEGIELVWTDLGWLILDIEMPEGEPTLDAVFGSDMLTSGWFNAVFTNGPDGHIQQTHFDFRNWSTGSAEIYFDITTTQSAVGATGEAFLPISPSQLAASATLVEQLAPYTFAATGPVAPSLPNLSQILNPGGVHGIGTLRPGVSSSGWGLTGRSSETVIATFPVRNQIGVSADMPVTENTTVRSEFSLQSPALELMLTVEGAELRQQQVSTEESLPGNSPGLPTGTCWLVAMPTHFFHAS